MISLDEFLKGFGVRSMLAEKVVSNSRTVKLAPGEHFLKAGKVADRIGYLVSGLLRSAYQNKEGQDITSKFYHPEGQMIVADYESFVNQKSSVESIYALEPTELLVLDKIEFSELVESSLELSEAVRLIADERFLLALKRIRQLQITPAKERVRLFVQHQGSLVGRASEAHIASYLGITLEEYQQCVQELGRSVELV